MTPRDLRGWVVGCVLCLWVCTAGASDCSADIHFPSTKISLDVSNTPTTVHFNVTSRCQADLGDYRLEIRTSDGSRPNMSSAGAISLCAIRRGGVADECQGRCEPTDGGLSCQATETFPRHSHRTWRVEDSSGSKIIAKVEVFDVTYPTVFTNFTVVHSDPPYLLTRRQDKQLFCSWEEGNPQRGIELRGPQNQTLKTVGVTPGRYNYLRHNLYNVDCGHSGQYRCGVKGGHEFKSLTLLVKCSWEFKNEHDAIQRSFETGSDAVFTFDVTSYTTDLTSCQLTTPSMTTISCGDNDKSDVTVEGSPPFFKLTVTLKTITDGDDGRWTLAVSNAIGSPDTVSFQLIVNAPTTTTITTITTTTTTTSKEGGEGTSVGGENLKQDQDEGKAKPAFPYWIFAPIGGVFVIGIIIIVFVYRRKAQNKGAPVRNTIRTSGNDDECEMIVNDLYGTSDTRAPPPSGGAAGGALYESMDDMGSGRNGNHAPPTASAAPDEGPMYVDQAEIQRNKARNKAPKQPPAQQDDGPMYVDQEEIKKNKARNKEKAQKQQQNPQEEENMYVDQAEIQRNKARNKGKAKKTGAQTGGGDVYSNMQ